MLVNRKGSSLRIKKSWNTLQPGAAAYFLWKSISPETHMYICTLRNTRKNAEILTVVLSGVKIKMQFPLKQ